jgi:hydroxyethylthiazole kinase-like uncharacterized protein yjeF
MYALTAKAMKYMDEYTIGNGVPSAVLMENASKGVVDEIAKRFDKGARVLVLCGQGNNGGDAVCVARWLLHMGYETELFFVGDRERLSKECLRQIKIIMNLNKDLHIAGMSDSERDIEVLSADYDVIVDGIFGIGLNRRFGYNLIKLIEYINSKKAYKVAIDIPSGLHATSGKIMEAAFRADLTVTFGNYKTGMFFGEGRSTCGEIIVKDIGIAEEGYKYLPDKLFVCDRAFYEETKSKLVERPEKSHKGTFGTVGIVVGPGSMLGASMLAAKAAYRAGCGVVKILCPNKHTGYLNVSVPEAIAVPYRKDGAVEALDEFLGTVDAVLIGPGLKEDEEGRLLVKHVLAGDTPAVLDAGALNILSKNLKPLRKRKCGCVLTPHIGEMARLCGEDIAGIEKNRIGFTKKFSEIYGVSMVVKSDVSLVSLISPTGSQRLYLNTTGNSGLATAGSGDVLAGVIASLIAQGNSLNNSLLFGVMVHGLAAENYATDEDSKRKMMAGDIIETIF